MNSLLKVGDKVYVPFWVVLDHFDVTPPDPFIESTILNLNRTHKQSPGGPVDYDTCDIELGKAGLIAAEMPTEYIILPDQLQFWADKIADWIRNYPCSRTTPPTAST